MSERSQYLHNMSAPPKSVVAYAGIRSLAKASGASDMGVAATRFNGADTFGAAIGFCLPAGMPRSGSSAILDYLDVKPGSHPEKQLCALIDQRARDMPLPDGCLVLPATSARFVIWSDALSVLAILAKCSASVWLKAKSPSVHAALARREVSILVPPAFVPDLPDIQP